MSLLLFSHMVKWRQRDEEMFERHRGKDSIDVLFITIKYFHPSVNAIQPVCMDIVASSRVECLCCCSEYVLREKKYCCVPGVNRAFMLISEGIEPSTFSVLTKCDNRYTMKPCETHGRS